MAVDLAFLRDLKQIAAEAFVAPAASLLLPTSHEPLASPSLLVFLLPRPFQFSAATLLSLAYT